VKTKLRSLFLYTWAGYFVDLVIPCQAVCGDVTRIYLVHNEIQESYGAVAASSLTNRIISYFLTAIGLLAGILLVLTRANSVPLLVLQLLVVALLGTFAYLGGLFYLAIDGKAAEKVAGVLFRVIGFLRLNKYLSADLSERVKGDLLVLHEGFQTFRDKPEKLVKPIVFQFLSVTLNIAVHILVFYSRG